MIQVPFDLKVSLVDKRGIAVKSPTECSQAQPFQVYTRRISTNRRVQTHSAQPTAGLLEGQAVRIHIAGDQVVRAAVHAGIAADLHYALGMGGHPEHAAYFPS